jgi:hypothetical protein
VLAGSREPKTRATTDHPATRKASNPVERGIAWLPRASKTFAGDRFQAEQRSGENASPQLQRGIAANASATITQPTISHVAMIASSVRRRFGQRHPVRRPNRLTPRPSRPEAASGLVPKGDPAQLFAENKNVFPVFGGCLYRLPLAQLALPYWTVANRSAWP